MKIFQWIAYITIFLALVLMSIFLYWSVYPYNPIEFKTNVYPILNEGKIATHGGVLKYEVDYCKTSDLEPIVTKWYVDGLIYQTPEGRGVIFPGCRKQVVNNLVPDSLIPGEYYMKIFIDYEMNPIRHIIYENITEKFTVLPKE